MFTTVYAFVTSSAGMTWLLACALKAGLLLAAAGLGAALLRRGTAAARHLIWTLGITAALLLPVLSLAAPALMGAPLTEAPRPVIAPPATSLPAASISADAPTVGAATAPGAAHAPTWPLWLAALWATGSLVVVIRLVRGQLAARRLRRTATSSADPIWIAAQRDAATTLGLARPVALLRSAAIATPMTVGVLRPCVLLPIAADAWSSDRLRAVLTHELGHVRRRDTTVQLAAQLACALYWWNPLAWLAAARLRLEREHACDDLVLHAGVTPSTYAHDLLDVARALVPRAHADAVGMVDRSWTAARLRRIVDATTARQPLGRRFSLATGALAVAAAATLACTSDPPALPQAKAATAPAARGPAVTLGTPSLREAPFLADPTSFAMPASGGTFDVAAVTAEVEGHLGELQQCYARRLAVTPTLAGQIVIHGAITPSGDVADVCIIEDTVGDRELAECVNQLIKARHFAPPRGGSVDVQFPLTFVRAGA